MIYFMALFGDGKPMTWGPFSKENVDEEIRKQRKFFPKAKFIKLEIAGDHITHMVAEETP